MENKEQQKVYLVTELTDATQQQHSSQGAVTYQQPRFTRLPNPEIPYEEYRQVSRYCDDQPNMTRQDWMELAIIEKMHRDNLITDSHYTQRRNEITSRPPRGQRKNTRRSRK